MKKISTDNWSVGNADSDDPESIGGGCYADWTVDLVVDGVEHSLGGWNVCGWLAPGASQDLDGSGLALWGNSQPGGWTTCDSDGSGRGYPKADYEVTTEFDDGDNEIITIVITVSSSDNRNETYEFSFDGTESEAEALCEAISEALRGANPGCDEPDSEKVFDDIDDDAFGFGAYYPIRFGNWKDAGKVLAWKIEGTTNDSYDHAFWPDAGDVSRAMRAVNDDIETTIMLVVEPVGDDLNSLINELDE